MASTDGRAVNNHAAFIWSIAELLRGDYKQSEYGKVVLPFTVLRRLDCVLEATKPKVLAKHAKMAGKVENIDPILENEAGQQFFNTSPLDLPKLLDDPANVADNLRAYIADFSSGARDVLEKFEFEAQIARLDKANLLYLVLARFCEIDLHPDAVSNIEMGYLYEELIRRFSELSNETAGEHFTPREVIRLMVGLLFIEDDRLLARPGVVKTLYDPACGTGGMLSVAEDYLRRHNPKGRLEVFGQELNAETYAVCRSDMMLKGQDASRIVHGNSFTDDGHPDARFDYLLANPPFGVEWKKVADPIKAEHETKGFGGRFGAGLPRITDGSFLFLQHMISKMKRPEDGGSRLAIVFNGSPLFTGAAGSGESEIRRWIIENDWLEAVVALPDQLFYNTGISTYFWVVTNRKSPERRGTVQLVDARDLFTKMRKSLGEKRKQISEEQVAEIVRLYGERCDNDRVKTFRNEEFGFMRITVERPLRVRYEMTPEAVEELCASKPFAKLDAGDQAALRRAFERLVGRSSLRRMELDWWLVEAAAAELEGTLVETRCGGDIPDHDPETEHFPLGEHYAFSITGQYDKPLPPALEKLFWKAVMVADPEGQLICDKKGNPEPDPDLRDNENVPLPAVPVTFEADVTDRLATVEYRTTIDDYMQAEVLPYVPDAWADHDKTRIGYEIPLTRHFYKYVPPRALAEIDAEIKQLESEIQDLLREVTE